MVSIRAWTPTATLTVDPATLPDEPVVLKQLVMQLFDELQKAKAALQRQEHHMHLLLRRLYGSTSEKLDPQQALLFDPRPDGRPRTSPCRRQCRSPRRLALQTAIGMDAAAFPRRSSVRKSFTI